MKKFELTNETIIRFGRTLYRIKALISFGIVSAGDLGGYVEKEENLSQNGNAWIYGNAEVYGNAWVSGNAWIYGNAEVYGNAWVSGNAWIYGNAEVYGDARVSGNAWIYGNAEVYGDARIYGNARVSGNAWIYGNAEVYGDARIYGNAWVCGNAWIYGNAEVYGDARVSGNAEITKSTHYLILGLIGSRNDTTTFFRTKQKEISVKCGCFLGSIFDFRLKVKETHASNKHAKVYELACQLAEAQIDLSDNDD